MKDYYDILGVQRNATQEDIKRSYRILAQQFHPDKENGSEKRFKEINEAYRVLSGTASKIEYDAEYDRRANENQEPLPSSKQTTQAVRNSGHSPFVAFLSQGGWIIVLVALGIGISLWSKSVSSPNTQSQDSQYVPDTTSAQSASATQQDGSRQANSVNTPASSGNENSSSGGVLPTKVGQCDFTTVSQIGTRLMDGTTNQPIPGTGSAIWFADGGYQVSYDDIPGVDSSQVGDHVELCLVSLPTDCPPGDDRGKVYSAINQRTQQQWTAQDSEHSCGGA